MSKDRIVSSLIMATIVFVGVVSDFAFLLVLLAFTIGGLYEFFYLVQKKGIPIYSYTGIGIGILIPLSIYFRFEPTKGWELLFIIIVLLMIFLLQFARKDNTNAIVGISTTMFGVLYVSWLLSFLVKIRVLLPEGTMLLGFILIVTKCSDIGALVVGSRLGKHPLLPRISPNKTIEGCLGGLAFSSCAAVLAKGLIPDYLDFSTLHVALMGVFFGALGQLGDMSESLIKRDCGVKDSGRFLPAVGGVLDTIDSVLFSAPAFYFYMTSAFNLVK